MDSDKTRRRGSYQYVPRRPPKSDNGDNKGHQHSHHKNKGHHHHDSIEKQSNSPSSNQLIEKTIGSGHDHASTGNTHEQEHLGRGAHHHMTSSRTHNHDSFGHFNHELVMNQTDHDAMNSNINNVYNSTNSTFGVLNSTMPIMHHSGHHDNGDLMQHGSGHSSNMINPKVDQSHMGGHMDGMSGHMTGMGGHMGDMGGHMTGMAGMAGMEGHHHGMRMYFSLKTDSYFLLEGLKISSIEGILSAMMFTILLTILVECIAYSIQYRQQRRKQLKGVSKFQRVLFQFATSLLHMMGLCSAYIAMLCVMSMNIWLLVSVIVGSGVGHLLIKPLLRSCCTIHDDHVSNTKKLNHEHHCVNVLLNTDEESS